MARGIKVPVGADVVDRLSGSIVDPGGPNDGKPATITLHRGFFSQGYKSDFEKVETWWFTLNVHGEYAYTFRYSGKRIPIAREQFDDCVGILRAVA